MSASRLDAISDPFGKGGNAIPWSISDSGIQMSANFWKLVRTPLGRAESSTVVDFGLRITNISNTVGSYFGPPWEGRKCDTVVDFGLRNTNVSYTFGSYFGPPWEGRK